MTIPDWPATLPRPERNTWQAQPQDARQRRQSDAGPAGYRGRFSHAAKTVTMSVLLDRNQRAVFENFFVDDTAKGSKLFWMPDPTTHGWSLLTETGAPLLMEDGRPILLGAWWLVTFGQNLPAESIVGVHFRMTFNVEVMP